MHVESIVKIWLLKKINYEKKIKYKKNIKKKEHIPTTKFMYTNGNILLVNILNNKISGCYSPEIFTKFKIVVGKRYRDGIFPLV